MISNRQQTKQSLLKEISRLRKTVADLEKKLQTKTAIENNNKTLNHKQKLLSDFASFAIESLSDGAFLIAKDASLVYVNRAACKQLGYTEEELLGMRVMDFNLHLTQEIWDAVWGVTVRDKIQTIEVEHLTKDGRLVPFEVLANYIELYGEQYSCSFTRDITDRKKSEKEIKQRVKELEEFYALAVGRELRMKQLKNEIEKLTEKLEKYKKQ
ncbi:MAG: PAS domain S-box protein [Thermodesulfovibrionales bacterium]|nr:PAS domain S-box protein [Thermodesulfovibrionales bacterium]